MAYHDEQSESPSHSFGVAKGEERLGRKSRGRRFGHQGHTRDSRDATSINADCRAPIDPRMPKLPPP
jgi:hypothetical protein